MNYLKVPDSNIKLTDGSVVMLARFPGTKWVVHYGWYDYSGRRGMGWYFSSIPAQTVIPVTSQDLQLIVVIDQGGSDKPDPPLPPVPPVPPGPGPMPPYPPEPGPHPSPFPPVDPVPGPDSGLYPFPPEPGVPPGDLKAYFSKNDQYLLDASWITLPSIRYRDALKTICHIPDGKVVKINNVDGVTRYYAWNAPDHRWDEKFYENDEQILENYYTKEEVDAIISVIDEKLLSLESADVELNAKIDHNFNVMDRALQEEKTARHAAEAAEAEARQAADEAEAQARVAAILSEKEAREAADAAESQARVEADEAEKSERQAADALESAARQIADESEAAAREAADELEKSERVAAIEAEAAARIAGDEAHGTALDEEIAAREAADSAEAQARAEADEAEEIARIAAINTEAASREEADNLEAQARVAADESITSNLQALSATFDTFATDVNSRIDELTAADRTMYSEIQALRNLVESETTSLKERVTALEDAVFNIRTIVAQTRNTVLVSDEGTLKDSGVSIGDDVIEEPHDFAHEHTLATEKAVVKLVDDNATQWSSF